MKSKETGKPKLDSKPKVEIRYLSVGRFKLKIPEDLIGVLKPILEKWEWLLPNWMLYCNVLYEPAGDGDAAAQIVVEHAYRFATITIFPYWVDQMTQVMEQNIVHEIVHSLVAPMAGPSKRIVSNMQDQKFLFGLLTDFEEMIVQDIADKLLNGNPK